MPLNINSDLEYRKELIEHLLRYVDMFHRINARSVVSSLILLYGLGVQQPLINNLIIREPLQNLRSFRLNIRVGNADVFMLLNRDLITQTLADVYYMFSETINRVYLAQTLQESTFTAESINGA